MPKAKSVRKLQLLEANAEEDKVIKQLEKSLKLKKRKRKKKDDGSKKIHNMFKDDGLDYILGVLDRGKDGLAGSDLSDFEDNPNSINLSEDVEPSTSLRPKQPTKPRRLIDLLPDEENSNENDNNTFPSDDESVRESDEEEDDAKGKILVKKPKIWEDIYGRLRDESGNVLNNKNSEKEMYVPPAKRMKVGSNDGQKKAQILRIQRQLKGLLNRLSESNLQSISNQVEEMYMKNSRNDMNETLMSLISELVISSTLTPSRLAMEQAMLVAILHANVGSEVGAFFLQHLAVQFDGLLKMGENYGPGKQCNNLLIFLSHLYNFKVTSSTLIFDILTILINSFTDKDIELIQELLRNVGFSLRKDKPLKLKETIISVQTKAPAFQSKDGSSRVQFMLDTLTAIKNNNMFKIPDYDYSIIDHAKKVLRTMVRSGSAVQELVISFQDLLKAEEKGRWWIVGSAWSERTADQNDQSSGSASFLPVSASVSDEILELAQKQHMSTEIRKTIFCVIMTAEDYVDCFEKILRLNLKNQQERDIVSVLLHCLLNEKTFNPYYAFLAGKFCKFARKYQMSLQFSLWDKFKEINTMKSYQVDNLAQFLQHLFLKGDLPISVLKVIHFSEMNKTMVRFFRRILLNVLLHDSEEVCVGVFQRIAPAKNLNLLKEGLKLFIRHFMLRNTAKYDERTVEKLENRAKLVESTLNSGSFKL